MAYTPTIFEGPFAEVYVGGNCVTEYIADGDDLMERANAIRDEYWAKAGHDAQIKRRNLPLYGIGFIEVGYPVSGWMYTSREAAERALARMQSNG